MTTTDTPDTPNTPDPWRHLTLSPAAVAQVRLLAQKPGVELDTVDECVRADIRASQGGGRTEAERRLEFAQRHKTSEEVHLQEARTRLKHAEPKIVLKGHRARVGVMSWLAVLSLLVGLLALLYYENGASATILLGIGAFGVDSIERARMMMLTPIAVGIAFVLAFKVLPHFLRRTGFALACGLLLVAFAAWALSFAIQTEQFRNDAAQGISLASDASVVESDDPVHEGGASAWIMLGSTVIISCLTSFIGHAGIEAFIARYETFVPNPEHTRAHDAVMAHEAEIRKIDNVLIGSAGELAAYLADEEQAAAQAKALYKAWKHLAGALLFVIATTGCMDGGKNAGPAAAKLQRWSSQSAKANGPVVRVLALSPLLPDAEKSAARAQLEAEVTWIAEEAPLGSVTAVVDALSSAPIARLEAVPGAPRIRKKALKKPAMAIKEFLDKPHPRLKDDGRIHLPRLAQTLKQLGLPAGTHVVVLGNPLFLNDGKDKFFSMADGQVPSDGCLFEDPKLNLYSVVGRGKALAGQFWHLGWQDDSVFEDDTQRQAVLRFWTLYLKEQSAFLVTAQPSFVAAIEAAREGATDPLMYADADANVPPAMVKIVQVEQREEIEVKPKIGDDAARGNQADADAEQAEAAARRDREANDAQRRKTEENETTDVTRKNPRQSRDRYGNLVGSKHDLIVDGQMKGEKILLAAFYEDDDVEQSPLGGALAKKGFEVERIGPQAPPLAAFETKLDDSRQLWLWSSPEDGRLPNSHLQAIVARWRQGKLALCLLADNTPFTREASAVLAAISPGCTLAGDYAGAQILHARQRSGGGFDAQSPLFHNVSALFEGRTVSTMSGPGLVPVCYASNGSPLIATLRQPGSSRLVVHGGFTSMYKSLWDESGISRFAVNCAGWLGEADAGAEPLRKR
jgi:hypothetical protein